MNKARFPLYCTVIGMIMMLLVIGGSQAGADGHTVVPLLALLAICEVAFFMCLAGAYIGFSQIKQHSNQQTIGITAACAILAVLFALRGLALWPG